MSDKQSKENVTVTDCVSYYNIDYRELLKKYMEFVGDEEGITFVHRLRKWDVDPNRADDRLVLADGFTEAEVKELESIESEMLDERDARLKDKPE